MISKLFFLIKSENKHSAQGDKKVAKSFMEDKDHHLRSHIGLGGERNILYEGVETSP